jgi:hypothetical protein
MVAALLPAIASAVASSSVAAGAAGAAATVAGSAASASAIAAGTAGFMASYGGAASLIGAGLTAASAFGSIMSGNQQAGIYKAQAAQSELSARTEELKGRDQADKIRRGLQSTLASQNAIFAARGISLSGGTPLNIGNQSRTEAARDIELAQFGAGISAAQERAQGQQYRMSARGARTSGYINAATSLAAGGSSFGSLLPR